MRQQATEQSSAAFSSANMYQRRLWITDSMVVCLVTVTAQYASSSLDTGARTAGQEGTMSALLPVALAIGWMIMLSAYRTRDARVIGTGADEYRRVVHATLMLLGLVALSCLTLSVDIPRGYFILALPLGVAGLLGTRWSLRRWLSRQRQYGRYLSRVIVLGRGKDVRYVINQIDKKSGAAYKIVGVALPKSAKMSSLTVNGKKIPVVSDPDSVVSAVAAVHADAVIVAGSVKGGSKYVQRLGWKLEKSATELVLATGLTNVAGPRIHLRPVEGLPLMHVELPQYAGPKHVLKRLLDIVLSVCALIALIPLFVVLAALIHRDSSGPVLFRQERIGRGAKRFSMLKFRSMVTDAEERLPGLLENNQGAGPLFKMQDDPRVTNVGKWMRRYSLDELPQFWNVLLGDMSLVGPRPPLQREVDGYKTHVHRRLYIKPGLTGMWQTSGRSELSWKESVRLDLYYVENWSLIGDLVILLRTARMLLRPTGAY